MWKNFEMQLEKNNRKLSVRSITLKHRKAVLPHWDRLIYLHGFE
jgi:hypothetical protein